MFILNELINDIAKELNIKKGNNESEDRYNFRLIYSALGHIALGSLYEYDSEDNKKSISIKHFKGRIKETGFEYLKIFSNMNSFFTIKEKSLLDETDEKTDIYFRLKLPKNKVEEKSLSDEIYNIYFSTGYFYHLSNNISQSIYSEAKYNGIKFIRGNSLSDRVYRSGLGAYLENNDNYCDFDKIVNMFHLHKIKLFDYWKYFIEEYITKKMEYLPNDIQYLRTSPQYDKIWGIYWIDTPDNDITLARYTIDHKKKYYLFFRKENKGVLLPSYLIKEFFIGENTNGSEYLYLANSLLSSLGRLPKIKYKINGDIVEFSLTYLLPPAELNLIKLYSWQKYIFDKDNKKYIFESFSYIMDKNVFEAIKNLFEKLGYKFVEDVYLK